LFKCNGIIFWYIWLLQDITAGFVSFPIVTNMMYILMEYGYHVLTELKCSILYVSYLQMNKFQALLTTDGVKSFVVYIYNKLLWTKSKNTKTYAMVSK